MRLELEFDDSFYDFTLIAIDTVAEDCQIAFLINKYLNLVFIRVEDDLSLFLSEEESETKFPLFTYKDDNNEWFLISNFSEFIDSVGMFNDSISKKYLVKEQKNIKFFLKIVGNIDEVVLLDTLNNIPEILFMNVLDPHSLKSKEVLIF